MHGLSVLRSGAGPGAVEVRWPDTARIVAGPATVYDLVSGSIVSLWLNRGTAAAACLPGADLASTSFVDARRPPGPARTFYLVRAQNVCGGDGSMDGWGSDSSGVARLVAMSCP